MNMYRNGYDGNAYSGFSDSVGAMTVPQDSTGDLVVVDQQTLEEIPQSMRKLTADELAAQPNTALSFGWRVMERADWEKLKGGSSSPGAVDRLTNTALTVLDNLAKNPQALINTFTGIQNPAALATNGQQVGANDAKIDSINKQLIDMRNSEIATTTALTGAVANVRLQATTQQQDAAKKAADDKAFKQKVLIGGGLLTVAALAAILFVSRR